MKRSVLEVAVSEKYPYLSHVSVILKNYHLLVTKMSSFTGNFQEFAQFLAQRHKISCCYLCNTQIPFNIL